MWQLPRPARGLALVTGTPLVEGDPATFAGLLRVFRSRAGLTQEMLAERAGVSRRRQSHPSSSLHTPHASI